MAPISSRCGGSLSPRRPPWRASVGTCSGYAGSMERGRPGKANVTGRGDSARAGGLGGLAWRGRSSALVYPHRGGAGGPPGALGGGLPSRGVRMTIFLPHGGEGGGLAGAPFRSRPPYRVIYEGVNLE